MEQEYLWDDMLEKDCIRTTIHLIVTNQILYFFSGSQIIKHGWYGFIKDHQYFFEKHTALEIVIRLSF